jgi:hypothetical protein
MAKQKQHPRLIAAIAALARVTNYPAEQRTKLGEHLAGIAREDGPIGEAAQRLVQRAVAARRSLVPWMGGRYRRVAPGFLQLAIEQEVAR